MYIKDVKLQVSKCAQASLHQCFVCYLRIENAEGYVLIAVYLLPSH